MVWLDLFMYEFYQNNSGAIEFWNEDDAKVAEEAMHCAEVDGISLFKSITHLR